MARIRIPLCLALASLSMLAGCPNEVTTQTPPSCDGVDPNILTSPILVPPIDILLTIDNSRSMADKQAILALAVPDLVLGLVNPRCYDENGVAALNQPALPTDDCPDPGTQRRVDPATDIHIGVITTSIGGHGADSCPDVDDKSEACAPAANLSNNDKGRLIAREGPCASDPTLSTYQGKGFLAWDPGAEQNPPGETVIDDGNGNGLVPTLRDMTLGAGQIGCGYESQLESIYRFLIDPDPYESISVVNNKATPMGTDTVLLEQRAAFLRPDSLLSVILLTDENDCSIKEYGQFYYVGQLRIGAKNVRMPRARQECATNPESECCKSCGQSPGSCPADPTCDDGQGGLALLSIDEDDINLRCWDQKRRFGIDFLYPIDRYVQGFTSNTITNRAGELVPNPLFLDLNQTDEHFYTRDPGMVFVSGILGVPWQDIARDPVDAKKGFMDSNELSFDRGDGWNTWDIILGDPAKYTPPLDPLMRESVEKRSGTNPVTGAPLADASTPDQNPINGHEWTIANDDLQYACIFPLLPGTERDCKDTSLAACDCRDSVNDNPLCAPNPNDTGLPTLQTKAKAYPAPRQIQLLKDLGSQATVASICPVQVYDQGPDATDFGYRPAIQGILDRLTSHFDYSQFGQCLPRSIPLDAAGKANCAIVEAFHAKEGACTCDSAKGRVPVAPERECLEKKLLEDPRAAANKWNCVCEIKQLEGAEGEACRNDTTNPPEVGGAPVNGFCYVDALSDPPIGNAELTSRCPDAEKRILRFVGEGEPVPGSGSAIVCQGDTSP